MVAKVLNAHLERTENFWSNEQASVVHLVDALVSEDDRVGELAIALAHRLNAFVQCPLGERPHFADLAADAVDVALQTLFQMRSHVVSATT